MRLAGFLALAALLVPVWAACSEAAGSSISVKLTTPTPTAAGGATLAAKGVPTPTGTPIPPPEMLVSTTDVYQAGAMLVSVVGEITGGTITFLERKSQLTQGKQSMYAFVGVGTDDPVGPHPMKVDFTLKNGSKGSLSTDVNVLKTQWTVDSLTFTEAQTEALLDPNVVDAENKQLEQVYATYTPEKLWDGPWRLPVQGAITARFGEQRSINGSDPSGHHSGTDIGATEGTPVLATNSGRVVMARQMALRGNMVIIDHGGGLLSGYGHMSAFAVAEGQTVQAGDIIGYVGNTGLSTGAHLHWEMAAGGIVVDALRFTDGTDGF
jgi:hypothetical protein